MGLFWRQDTTALSIKSGETARLAHRWKYRHTSRGNSGNFALMMIK